MARVENSNFVYRTLGETKSNIILKTVLSESKKFGFGVCLINQRPSRLDSDSLSQYLTQIILKIVNPSDQRNIDDSLENVSKDLLNKLSAFTKGQAIVAGKGINTPVLIQVRQRKTSHGGVSLNAPKQWHKAFELTFEEKQIIEAKPIVQKLEEDFLD